MSSRTPSTLALLLSLLSSAPADANPWTRNAGSFYLNLAYSRISATGLYAPDFSRIDLPDRYTQQTLGAYAEVGVIDRWLTLTLDATLLRAAKLDNQGSTLGLGDMRLGAWTGLLQGQVHLSAGLILGLPTGDPLPSAGEGASRQDRQTAQSLPTGDGELDVELAVAAGTSFGGKGKRWPLQHYAIAQVGYWLRTEPRDLPVDDLPDAFNWRTELGTRFPWPVIDRFWFVARVFGSEVFGGEDEVGMSATGLGATAHTSWAVEIFARLWRGLGASFSFSGAFRAAGLPAGANLKFALSYER